MYGLVKRHHPFEPIPFGLYKPSLGGYRGVLGFRNAKSITHRLDRVACVSIGKTQRRAHL